MPELKNGGQSKEGLAALKGLPGDLKLIMLCKQITQGHTIYTTVL